MPSTGKVFPYLNSAISPTTRSACFTSIVSPPLMTENLRERGERGERGREGGGLCTASVNMACPPCTMAIQNNHIHGELNMHMIKVETL